MSGPRPVHSHAEDEICLCDLKLGDTGAIPDIDLPSATGGVEPSALPPEGDETASDCRVVGAGSYLTPDDELPPAFGGIMP